MAALLTVTNVRVRFHLFGPLKARLLHAPTRHLDAVQEISFAIEPGTTFALVGESGSGKTTLGRAINGLLPIESGSILFDGTQLAGGSNNAFNIHRRQMAMLFQDPVASLSPRLSIRSLISEPFLIHGVRPLRGLDAEVNRLLDLVGLPGSFADRYPHQLSGGQARRVGVARALALSPKLIIADEPTAGLDVSIQGDILNLMTTLQRELGLSYLLITHNLAIVRHISDYIAVMYMGRFVEHGATKAVFANPAHPYTHALLTAEPKPDPDQRRNEVGLQGETPSLMHRPDGCEFHTRCAFARTRCTVEAPQPRLLDGRTVRCHFALIDDGSENRLDPQAI